MGKIQIPHNFEPRDYQVPLYNAIADGFKRGVAVWHRRAGKDKALFNITIKEAAKKTGTYYYFFPTYNQGRKVIWDGIDRAGMPFLDHVPKSFIDSKNNTEMKIKLRNKSIIQIVGTDNYNSIMGTNPVGCVFSEYSLQDPRAWGFIRPILMENDGWALFNFTPRGRNHGWSINQIAQREPEWFHQILTVNDTGAVTKDSIDKERREGMSEDLIQQEFYCSFDASLPGAYYANELRKAREDGRITRVSVESGIRVDTWWDLGMDDSTTIWFTQDCGREIHLIDYYEASGEGLAHYAAVLDKKKYLYGRHTAPHDIKVREIGTGKSRLQTARELGIDFKVAPQPAKKEDAIERCRNLFSVCCFDEIRCEHGINALSSYHKEMDEVKGTFKTVPVHDWSSHAADAFQTLALAHKFSTPSVTPEEMIEQQIKYANDGWMR